MDAITFDRIDDIPVDDIIVRPRLRQLSDESMGSLAESIREIGLIHPITVWYPEGSGFPELVQGLYRLEAMRLLGRKTIPCSIAPVCDADEAAMMEIAENLERCELSQSQRAFHTNKLKEIYDRKYPEAKAGGDRKSKSRTETLKTQAFIDYTATKTGKGRSTVARDVTRGKNIPRIGEIFGMSLDSWDELDALAKLPVERQEAIIDKAKAGEKVSAKNEAKKVIRKEREAKLGAKTVAASKDLGKNLYGVIYADPPWQFKERSEEGMDRAADNHYPTMTYDDLAEIDPPAAKDCVLFLWTTAPFDEVAHRLIARWGFQYKTHCIWVKDRVGTGYWFRNKHEILMVATRGGVPAPAPGDQFPSAIEAPVAEHSRKPALFIEMISAMFPNVPKIEMFARDGREGWDCWGSECPEPELAAVTEPADEAEVAGSVETEEVDTAVAEEAAVEGAVIDAPGFSPSRTDGKVFYAWHRWENTGGGQERAVVSVHSSQEATRAAAIAYARDHLREANPTITSSYVMTSDGAQSVDILDATLRGDDPGEQVFYFEKPYRLTGYTVAGPMFYANRSAVPVTHGTSVKTASFNPAIVSQAAKDEALCGN
jgi:N6-adenosine-specific RNA methylase IME4